MEISMAFRKGQYGSNDGAQTSALCELKDRNPGFTNAEYRTDFLAGQMGAGL
jgi:hypothetical protein